jgi:hypothetical protein
MAEDAGDPGVEAIGLPEGVEVLEHPAIGLLHKVLGLETAAARVAEGEVEAGLLRALENLPLAVIVSGQGLQGQLTVRHGSSIKIWALFFYETCYKKPARAGLSQKFSRSFFDRQIIFHPAENFKKMMNPVHLT